MDINAAAKTQTFPGVRERSKVVSVAVGALFETTRVVRVARSAPHVPLSDIAAAVAVPVDDMAAVLASASRGRCGRIAADIVSGARRLVVSTSTDTTTDTASTVASLRVCPPTVLRAINTDRDMMLRHTGRGTAAWVGRCKPTQPSVGGAFAQTAPAPRQLLVRLATSDDPAVRQTAAQASDCPAAMSAALAADPSPDVRAAAAANPNTNSATVGVCSGDSDWFVRVKAATNGACPPTVLEGLAADDYLPVRRAVAQNPSTSPGALVRLVEDNSDSWEILAAVAGRGDCPATTIGSIERHPTRQVADTASATLRTRSDAPSCG